MDEVVQVRHCRQSVCSRHGEAISQDQTISHCLSRPTEVRVWEVAQEAVLCDTGTAIGPQIVEMPKYRGINPPERENHGSDSQISLTSVTAA